MLKADDSLSSESSSEKDEDSTGLDATSELGSLLSWVSSGSWGLGIIAWVPCVLLDHLVSSK